MKKLTISCAIITLSLTACGSKQEAEAKLARGCEAALKVMLDKPDYTRQIDKVTGTSFGMSEGYRLVTLKAITKPKESGSEMEESFDCKFQETQMFNYIRWSADLVQLKIDDTIYGSSGGEIYGSVEDQIKLTNAVTNAMK